MKKYLILALCAIISVGLITGCGSKKEDKDKNKINREEGYTEGTIDLGSFKDAMIMESVGSSYSSGDVVKIGEGYGVISFDNNEVNYVCAEPVCNIDKEISNVYKFDMKQIPNIKFNSYFVYDGKKYNYESYFTFKISNPITVANNYGNQEVSVKMIVEEYIKPYLENNLSNAILEYVDKNGVDNIISKYNGGTYFNFSDYYEYPSELDNYGISLFSISIESVEEA